ncbi:invasion associated locus B family protein [Aliihoeflea sp. PC F10.4]
MPSLNVTMLTRRIALCVVMSFVTPASLGSQELAGPPYTVTPSDVRVPQGVEIGQFQRTIRPFGDWTLICDDNLAAQSTVCNVRQTISDRDGTLVFSWALAVTTEGDPYMLLRTSPVADSEGFISLKFEGRAEPVDVYFDGCNQVVCVGMLPVGPIMRGQIQNGSSPTISYPTRNGDDVTFNATLAGLASALEAIE